MYKNVLEHINGIEIFPLISLIVFFIAGAILLSRVDIRKGINAASGESPV